MLVGKLRVLKLRVLDYLIVPFSRLATGRAMQPTLIGPNNLEVDAVVPQCLDNQYVSDGVFSRMVSRGVDYRDQEIADLREHDFKTEFIRSLVYSSQVVIQRAFFKNSDFLYKNYLPANGEQFNAFAQLMREKAIVPFLFQESSLRERLKFDLSKAGDQATNALLDEVGTDFTCVRLAVDHDANQRAAASMATEFGNGLTRLAHMSDEQRNAMASELFSDPARLQEEGAWQAFERALDDLVDYSIARTRELRSDRKGHLTRQHVYQDNFVEGSDDQRFVDPSDDPTVIFGRFRNPGPDNPFLLELKKYVDLVYNVNLPDHLKRYTFTPANMPTRMALQDAPAQGYRHEDMSALVSDRDALESIRRTFMTHSQKAMSLPLLRDLTVADVLEIRGLPEWEPFKESQAKILKDPLQCLNRLEEFQWTFDAFQRALSDWYSRQYERPRIEERYCSYVSLALSLAGKLVVAGSDLGSPEKTLSLFASDQIVTNIPRKVKGYAAKLMVGVYDIGKRRLDADRTYTIELMQTDAELLREDVVTLLNSIHLKQGADLPGVSEQVADQGI
jgi:hypothetical protein